MNNLKTAIMLAQGYEMGEAIIIIDLLRRADIDIDLISCSNDLFVQSSHGVRIECQYLIDKISFNKYQMLILPGGNAGVNNLIKNHVLLDNLSKFSQQKNKKIAAICAAPQILGFLGIVNGKNISVYPGCTEFLSKAHLTNKCVEVSDNIITGKSIGCSFEFALAIIEQIKGKKTANEVAQKLVFNK